MAAEQTFYGSIDVLARRSTILPAVERSGSLHLVSASDLKYAPATPTETSFSGRSKASRYARLAKEEHMWPVRRLLVAATVFAALAFSSSPAFAEGLRVKQNGAHTKGNTGTTHTITWWCVDLNKLWRVDVPVVVGYGIAVPPDPSPIPNPCTNPFPVTVPNGSSFMPGGAAVWWGNKTYPPAIRAALQEMGYNFHSESPAQDFMSKFLEIRIEVRTFADNTLVAEFRFDPRKNFSIVRAREFFGLYPFGPIVDPALGINISIDAAGRLPVLGFPVIAGPVPPGYYRAWVYWTLSDQVNDGLGLEPGNFLPPGDYFQNNPPFIVLP
jgi:hypothetical protein